MSDGLTTRDLRYQYDEKEHVRLAEDLAHEITVLATAERLFGVAKGAHKEAVERMGATIRDLSRKLSDGWEIRDVVCRLLPNEPEAGKRTVVRVDTGEIVAVEDMYTGAAIESSPDKLFETVVESVVEQVNAGALDAGDVKCTATVTTASPLFDPKAEASTEERKRTRQRKHRGQDALLPDTRNSAQPGAPTV